MVITYGEVNETGGKYAGISLDAALDAVKNKRIDALVTAPIHKKSMEMSGFGFPGHTEFLADKFSGNKSLMLMVNDDLRIGVVTGHIALQDVAKSITKAAIIEKTQMLTQTLKMDFDIQRPVIAILGLNPHAGDQGLFGDEEAKVIQPAIDELQKAGHLSPGSVAQLDRALRLAPGVRPRRTLVRDARRPATVRCSIHRAGRC